MQATRTLHQTTCEDDYLEAAAEALGRPVTAMVSATHIDPDLLFEIFVLADPAGSADGGEGAQGEE